MNLTNTILLNPILYLYIYTYVYIYIYFLLIYLYLYNICIICNKDTLRSLFLSLFLSLDRFKKPSLAILDSLLPGVI